MNIERKTRTVVTVSYAGMPVTNMKYMLIIPVYAQRS